jgi:tRNA (guanine-N7-)-methyltransferase
MPDPNIARIRWDFRASARGNPEYHTRYEDYWKLSNKELIPRDLFTKNPEVWLEVGAGSGWFFVKLAELYPRKQLIAVERSRMRGQRLVQKASKSGRENLAAFRGNAIPVLIHGIPSESVERLYLLYPPPWPRNAQRKNRWYLHPIMPHMLRILKVGGTLIWASDQKFYIDEARFVCESRFAMTCLKHGPLEENPYNDLADFPGGRTKFEQEFLRQGLACHELIVQKNSNISSTF